MLLSKPSSLSGGRIVRAPGRGTHAPVVRVRNPPGIMSLYARCYEKGNDARWRFIICIYCCKLASVPWVRIKIYYYYKYCLKSHWLEINYRQIFIGKYSLFQSQGKASVTTSKPGQQACTRTRKAVHVNNIVFKRYFNRFQTTITAIREPEARVLLLLIFFFFLRNPWFDIPCLVARFYCRWI